jgi:hypothetical protein
MRIWRNKPNSKHAGRQGDDAAGKIAATQELLSRTTTDAYDSMNQERGDLR